MSDEPSADASAAIDITDLRPLTVEIVSAHVSNNVVPTGDVPGLITLTHTALQEIVQGPVVQDEPKPVPAVSIRASIRPDYLVCLEDGKKLKMLKRHLATSYAMTPDEYRQRWGLAADYPMVAPNYAKQRSELAKSIGLGKKPEPEPIKKVATGKAPRRTKSAA